MNKYKLEIIAFISGAAVMILELVGARILASHVGTSIGVWSALIGVILGCLSLGYWYGGKLADKDPTFRKLSAILFISAIAVFISAIGKSVLPIYFRNLISDIRLEAVADALVLFGPASFLLAMVAPYAVKLKMSDLEQSGRTVGNLYAVSTIGSIIGTFATGFWLLVYFENTKIMILLAILLAVCSLFAFFKALTKQKIVAILLFSVSFLPLMTFGQSFLPPDAVKINTQYNDIFLTKGKDIYTGRPILKLSTDPFGIQSAMFLDEDDNLVFMYSKFYRLADHFKSRIDNALVIGGAAYSFPKEYLKRYPEAMLDVVEIDPKMTETARKYFNLKDNPRLNIYHQDGRIFLNRTENKYDAIYVDAFNTIVIPWQLTTREAVEEMHDSLNDGGLVMVNLISSVNGDSGKFLRSEYTTYKAVFPQVYIFPVNFSHNGDRVQNIVLVAIKSDNKPEFKSKDEELDGYLQSLWKKEIKRDMSVLTDERAPVDQYMQEILKQY